MQLQTSKVGRTNFNTHKMQSTYFHGQRRSYLNFGTKRTEFPLKTGRFQAISLTINPCNYTKA